MNGIMKPEETKTLYDLLENADRLYADKIFLRYEIDDEVYEKTYRELFVIQRKQQVLFRNRTKTRAAVYTPHSSDAAVMNIFADSWEQ